MPRGLARRSEIAAEIGRAREKAESGKAESGRRESGKAGRWSSGTSVRHRTGAHLIRPAATFSPSDSEKERRQSGMPHWLFTARPHPGPAPPGRGRGGGGSNIQHPTSNIQHRTSNIEHPTSNIQHRTSNIEQLIGIWFLDAPRSVKCPNSRVKARVFRRNRRNPKRTARISSEKWPTAK